MLRKAVAVAMTLSMWAQSSIAASSSSQPALKAIDPSAAKMDAPPPPEASKPVNTNPFNSAIQGRPLGQMQPQTPQFDSSGGSPSPSPSPAPSAAAGGASGAPGGATGLTAMTPVAAVTPADEERVTRLERQAFGSIYSEHEVDDRLEHLEKEVLGAKKDGLPTERIARLEHKLLGSSGFGGSAPPAAPLTAAQQSQIGRGYPAPQAVPAPRAPFIATPGPQQQHQQPRMQGQVPQMQQPQMQAQVPQMQQPQMQAQVPMQQMQQMPQMQQPSLQQQHLPPGQIAQAPAWVAKPNFSPRAYSPGPAPRTQSNFIAQAPDNSGNFPTNPGVRAVPGAIVADAALVASSLIYDGKSGDYFSAIRRFDDAGGTYARWSNFPVKIRLPQGSPESWQRNLEAVIARWTQYVPVKMALPQQPADVDVQWVNQLPPRALGVTRLNITNGQIRVWVYLLRPSFYAAEIPERTLSAVFTREIGHALGLFGKSDKSSDLLYASDSGSSNTNAGASPVAGKKPPVKFSGISPRDINTLKKLYEAPATPPGLTLQQPLEWATSY